MHKPGDIWVPATCDCGHKFDISLVGHDPETMEFTCPGCGKVDRFTPEQAAQIVAQYEGAVSSLNDAIKKSVDDFNRRRK